MNEKSIDTSVDTFLVILLPLAFVIVFLFATWPVLLGLLLFSLGYKLWRRYQWQQWSQQVNPIFHQLIRASQGRITPMDLAMKANFSAAVAKRYLDCKAEEFGAQQQKYEDLGTVYYFITSSTLGSMLDESEPASESEQQNQGTQNVKHIAPSAIEDITKDRSSSAVQVLVPEADTSVEDSSTSSASSIVSPPSEATLEQAEPSSQVNSVPQSLIQSELAKRLNVYSSTVYKRRDDPDFSEWSRSRDPEGIAWKFSPKTKEFRPVKE